MHLHDNIPSPTMRSTSSLPPPDSPQTPHVREKWGNSLEYYMAVLGFAAGFGSVWRFPYLVWKNGGGVFLIPYTFFLFVLAIPIFYLEVAVGQLHQKGSPKLFESIHKKWKGLGLIPVIVAYNMSTYYNLIEAYSFCYFILSFNNPLPWDSLDPETNSILNKASLLYTIISQPFNKHYFTHEFLGLSDGPGVFGGFNTQVFIGYIVSMILVFLCIFKGIKLSGKITVYTACAPYVLLFILLARGVFLEGASSGIAYLLSPDLSKLWNITVWVDAINQIFFQISLGVGILTLFGSYRQKEEDLKASSFNIPYAVVLCGVLAAFTIFTYMGNMSSVANIPISQIPLSGPELTFVAYPTALSLMPFANFWAVIFFAMMIFLGIDTQFALVEGICAAAVDEGRDLGFNLKPEMIRLLVCLSVSFIGLLYSFGNGFYLLGIIDEFSTSLPFLFVAIVECYFFCWNQDLQELEISILENTKKEMPKFIKFSVRYLAIPICGVLFLMSLVSLITKSLDLSFGIALLGWFFSLYPFLIAYLIYHKHKDVIALNHYKTLSGHDLELKHLG